MILYNIYINMDTEYGENKFYGEINMDFSKNYSGNIYSFLYVCRKVI